MWNNGQKNRSGGKRDRNGEKSRGKGKVDRGKKKGEKGKGRSFLMQKLMTSSSIWYFLNYFP